MTPAKQILSDNPEFDPLLNKLNSYRAELYQSIHEARNAAAYAQMIVGRTLALHDRVSDQIRDRRAELGLPKEAEGDSDET